MDDRDVDFLLSCLANPNILVFHKYYQEYNQVTCYQDNYICPKTDVGPEEVFWLDDGSCVAVLASSRKDFRIFHPITFPEH